MSFAAEGEQSAQAALWSQMSKAAPPTALRRARLRLGEDATGEHDLYLNCLKAAAVSSL